MKAVVAAFNQEKALVGAFSKITNLRMELFQALVVTLLAALGSEKSINKAEKIKETVINAKIQLCNAITENAAMLNRA